MFCTFHTGYRFGKAGLGACEESLLVRRPLRESFQVNYGIQTAKWKQELLHGKQKQLEKDEKRIAELDRLFIRLYEDNVATRISDDRFAMMSQVYEDEQRELKAKAEVLRQEIETQEQQNQNLELFIQKVRKYADMTELTPYAAHVSWSRRSMSELRIKAAENAARASTSAMI